MPPSDAKVRAKYIRDFQLKGGTYEEAAANWNEAGDVVDGMRDFQGRLPKEVSKEDISDAISDWRAIKEAGL